MSVLRSVNMEKLSRYLPPVVVASVLGSTSSSLANDFVGFVSSQIGIDPLYLDSGAKAALLSALGVSLFKTVQKELKQPSFGESDELVLLLLEAKKRGLSRKKFDALATALIHSYLASVHRFAVFHPFNQELHVTAYWGFASPTIGLVKLPIGSPKDPSNLAAASYHSKNIERCQFNQSPASPGILVPSRRAWTDLPSFASPSICESVAVPVQSKAHRHPLAIVSFDIGIGDAQRIFDERIAKAIAFRLALLSTCLLTKQPFPTAKPP